MYRIQWASNGGTTAVRSYGADIMDPSTWHMIPFEHLAFFLACPIAICTPWGVVTHAFARKESVDLMRTYERGEAVDMDLLRRAAFECMWERDPPKTPIVDNLWHVSGHTPLDRVKRHRQNRWVQIDTGCVYKRRLTAMDFSSRRLLAVDAGMVE